MNTSNIANYKPKDFAELLGVSVKILQHCNTATLQHCNTATLQHCNTATLQHGDRDGILKANRTPNDRRYYIYD